MTATKNEATTFWADAAGRTWSTAISVNAIRRAKDLAGVNLLEVFDGDLLPRLADDPVLLVNTLYAVCKPQADERNLTDEAFGELLVGDTIELAAAALVQGMADFFPQDRRAVLLRLWAATVRTRTEAIRMATAKLDSPLIDQAIDAAIRQASDTIDQRLRSFSLETPPTDRGTLQRDSAATARQPPYGNSSGSSPESSASIPAP